MPSRAWEFAAGGLLSLWPSSHKTSSWIGSLLQGTGLLILVFCVLYIDPHFVFPGIIVLLPVLGSLLFIAGGIYSIPPSAGKFLYHRYLVYIGKISYSFYLWHWVFLSFTRYWFLERQLTRDTLAGLGLALCTAHLSYVYVEQPIRKGNTPFIRLNQLSFKHGIYTMLCLYVLGNLQIFFPLTIKSTSQQFIVRVKKDSSSLPSSCKMPAQGIPLPNIAHCSLGTLQDPIRILAWGDSHTGRMLPVYQAYTQQHPVRILMRIYDGCPALMQVIPAGNGHYRTHCLRYANAVVSQIQALKGLGLSGIIIDMRWFLYTATDLPGTVGLLLPGQHSSLLKTGHGLLNSTHALSVLHTALFQQLSLFQSEGLKVILVLPEPELRLSAPECIARFSPAQCNRPTYEFLQMRSPLISILNEAQKRFSNLKLIDTLPFFCDHQWCYAQQKSIINFVDTDHMTKTRALTMIPYITPYLNWLALPEQTTATQHKISLP